MNLQSNDFELFGLPVRFELDTAELSQAYLRLQSQTHPDRHANGTAQEKRLAVQWATRINEAYRRLGNPLERAVYWCELQGLDPRSQQSRLPAALLMQQMEWREAAEDSHSVDALDALMSDVRAERRRQLAALAVHIDQEPNPQNAMACTQALMFIDKFLLELDRRLEQLEDAS